MQNYFRSWNNVNERELLTKMSKTFARQFKRSKLTKEQEEIIVKEMQDNKELKEFNNQTFNLLKIYVKTRNWQLFRLMEKIIYKNEME